MAAAQPVFQEGAGGLGGRDPAGEAEPAGAGDMINTIQAALFAAADQEEKVTPLKFWAGIKYAGID